mmetsp:Transcript_2993/g.7171  ORF Transcript_2993/g.7171 Transcript_2993/m.7171 type:complete len:660 (+) Transcript_2993:50-2029(+)
MWFVWILLLIAYAALTWQSLLEASAPAVSCKQREDSSSISWNCYRPAVRVGDELSLQLEIFHTASSSDGTSDKRRQSSHTFPRWNPVDTCSIDFVVPPTGKLPRLIAGGGVKIDNTTDSITEESIRNQGVQQCEVMLPAMVRHRSNTKSEVRPLKARFVVLARAPRRENDEKKKGNNENGQRTVVETTPPFFLTRVEKRKPSSMIRLLLNSGRTEPSAKDFGSNTTKSNTSDANNSEKDVHNYNETMWIPYLKFGRSPIRIRFVAEDRGYAFLQRADGISLKALDSSFYAPMIYVDELSLQQSAQIELAPFEDNRPAIKMQIKFGSISPLVDTLYRQVRDAFEMIESSVFQGPELDELRYFLQDENLYRFALTNIISTLHMWLDYLAFRDEVRFYRGKQNLSGVSPSSVITKMICSLIILLYLIDGGGTSWIVLTSLFSSFVVEAWKVFKLLRPTISADFPYVKIRDFASKQEEQTAEYDRIACRKLSLLLYPTVFGWSIYALKHYEYKSVYSWFISNLANGVYTFGFISMCPQIYVNYRLKSVAHLPWKVFMYKIFNTFVDDAFAWLIEMPLKHRLMTLRDDVVFLCFLVQVYIYRVDKTRSNEFGYSYEEEGHDSIDTNKPYQCVAEEKCKVHSTGISNVDEPAPSVNNETSKLKAE